MQKEKPRILVVDDEKLNRNVLTELLKPEYTVILAKDGQQALDKAHSQHPPELILMDVIMPEMDGYTSCIRLKESDATQDIPVIFITSLQEPDDEKKGLEVGAIDYISKPFSPAIVLARVRNHLALAQARKKLAEAHTLLEEKNKLLQVMATKDSLTQLCNRFSLDENLHREVSHAQRFKRPLSVLLMDIDLFKQVNDTYGHQLGDEVLKKIAELLHSNVRETDTCGRWGGEEFLIICPETDIQGAFVLAENLRKSVERAYFPPVEKITASFGIATFIEGESGNSLIRRADQGLYSAKASGRNCVKTAEM